MYIKIGNFRKYPFILFEYFKKLLNSVLIVCMNERNFSEIAKAACICHIINHNEKLHTLKHVYDQVIYLSIKKFPLKQYAISTSASSLFQKLGISVIDFDKLGGLIIIMDVIFQNPCLQNEHCYVISLRVGQIESIEE